MINLCILVRLRSNFWAEYIAVNAALEYYASVLSHLQFQSVSNYVRDHKSIYTVALISQATFVVFTIM